MTTHARTAKALPALPVAPGIQAGFGRATSTILFALVLHSAGLFPAEDLHEAQPPSRYLHAESELLLLRLDSEGHWTTWGRTPAADWRGVPIPEGQLLRAMPLTDFTAKPEALDFFSREAIRLTLAGLDLSECEDSADQILKRLAGTSYLEWLWLDNVQAATIGLLKGLSGLKHLSCQIEDPGLAESLPAACPGLVELSLNCSNLTARGGAALARLPGLRKLRLVAGQLDPQGLAALGQLTELKELGIHKAVLSDTDLFALRGLKNLEKLELPDSHGTERGLRPLLETGLSYVKLGSYSYLDPFWNTRLKIVNPLLEGHLPQFISPEFSRLPAKEEQQAKAWIKGLDSENYQVRVEARNRLLALDLKAVPLLVESLERETRVEVPSLEMVNNLRGILDFIRKQMDGGDVARTLKQLDRIVQEAPALFMAPGRQAQVRLGRTVSFEFIDLPTSVAVQRLSEFTGVPILIDPAAGEGLLPINLRVSDMNGALALEWIAQLAQLKAVAREDVAIVTTPDRARKLSLQAQTFDLPVVEGEARWTQEETAVLAGVLRNHAIFKDVDGKGIAYGPAKFDRCEPKAPGRVLVHGTKADLQGVREFLWSFRHLRFAEPPALPEGIQAVERALDLSVSRNIGKMDVAEALQLLELSAKVSLPLDPPAAKASAGTTVTLESKGKSAREALFALLAQAGLGVRYHGRSLLIIKRRAWAADAQLVFLDLNPAEKAGVAQEALGAALDQLLPESCSSNARRLALLRGRWIGFMEPWTVRRAYALLRRAAETGKLEPPEPAPWFFRTH